MLPGLEQMNPSFYFAEGSSILGVEEEKQEAEREVYKRHYKVCISVAMGLLNNI